MTNKIIFSIKPKMFTVYDFHMDFQFWSKKVLPRDFQMGLTLPWLWEGCDWCGMDPKSLKMDFRDLYRSGHVWLSVVLIYPNLSAFWTHPNAQLYSTKVTSQSFPQWQRQSRIFLAHLGQKLWSPKIQEKRIPPKSWPKIILG